jgi:glycosyltransferase involved in cell wall biosynthesis
MKIGIITDSIDNGARGVGTYIRKLLFYLEEIDHENTYVLIHHKKVSDKLYEKYEHLIVPSIPLPFGTYVRKIIQLPKVLEKSGFDIVHEPMQIGPFFLKSNYKKVVTINDLGALKYPKIHSKMQYIRERFGIPIILQNVDVVIAISNETKANILTYFNIPEDKVKVIYDAVDENFRVIEDVNILSFTKSKYHLPDKFILNVATLEERKNIRVLIKAYYELIKYGNFEHKLVIVGKKGRGHEAIFEEVNDLGINEMVYFIEYVSEDSLPVIYNLASLFVFPSLCEGFGLPPLEAMACGCPVIASNTSSIPEVVGNAGLMCDPNNIDDLTYAMYRVLTDDELRISMIEKGLERATMFSWAKCAKETLEVYEKIYHK